MGLQELIERDVATMVGFGDGLSYSELCEMLGAYDRMQVIGAVNRLNSSGAIRLTDKGFVSGRGAAAQSTAEVAAEACENVEDGSAETPATSSELVGDGDSAAAGQAIDVALAERAEVSGNLRDDSIEATEPPVTAALAEKRREALLPGTVLNSTPLDILGLEEEVMDIARTRNIQTVFELVRSLDAFATALRPKQLARVIKCLVDLAGKPAVVLEDKQVDCLEDYALSSCFFFDWFGVLCTRLSPAMTIDEIKSFVKDGGLSRARRSKFNLAEFEGRYSNDAIDVTSSLRGALARLFYPLNGDALNVLMLPVIQEWFENGECDNQQEALEMSLDFVSTRPQTEEACFGFLRDKFDRIRQRAEAGEQVAPMSVAATRGFSQAAERLAQCEPDVRFDSLHHRLYYATDKTGK